MLPADRDRGTREAIGRVIVETGHCATRTDTWFALALGADPEQVRDIVRETVTALHDTLGAVIEGVDAPDFLATHLRTRMERLPLLRKS
ncbi:hypothetical protein GCM10010238_01130 [Streptomyces griseoviridis]|uniref:Uncharacterized protein n=1 Tax=Streptomyces griseoviridis TaxID=45398 RepID=A0A918G4Q6_STRGD|nr:hypothetical protein GCM10010238_01130 [Streptomyces niveoruber]